MMDRSFLSIKEVSEYLGIKKSNLYSKVEKKEIPCYHIGHLLRFKKEDIDKWMESHREERVDVDGKARGILKAINTPVADVNHLVKKTIAEVKGNGYTLHHGKPDRIEGLRKEGNDGTL